MAALAMTAGPASAWEAIVVAVALEGDAGSLEDLAGQLELDVVDPGQDGAGLLAQQRSEK